MTALLSMDSRYGHNKEHLSFSAIRLWKQNKDAYRRKYYPEEGESVSTVYTQFGKKIAEVLESRDYTQYPALEKVPFYSVSEQSVETEIEGVLVKGFLDLYEPETFAIGEVKTGIVSKASGPPWTALKVRQWEQLPFYSLLVKKKFGKVQNKCHLIWLETYFENSKQKSISSALKVGRGELQLTGTIKIFPRVIAEWERKRMQDDIINVAAEIQEDYATYLKSH